MDKVKGVEIDRVREKLIELLGNVYLPMTCGPDTIGEYRIPHKFKKEIADHLIANFVVIAENATTTKWIPVTDENPKEAGEYIVKIAYASAATALWYNPVEDVWFSDDYRDTYPVTHWMPLPEPPKGK